MGAWQLVSLVVFTLYMGATVFRAQDNACKDSLTASQLSMQKIS